MNVRMLDMIDRSGRVVFYPSSCLYSDGFQALPYDAVVLVSKGIKRPGKYGKVYCLNLDNNEALGVFASKGIPLSAMVIIRDGCVEGGNYECVASESFLGRLMPVMLDEFDYFTGHHRVPSRAPVRFSEVAVPIYLKAFVTNSDPLGPMRSFHVTAGPSVEREFVLGRIQVTVGRDTIWRAVEKSDYMVVNINNGGMAVPRYLRGRLGGIDPATRVDFVSRSSPVTSIERYLRLAEERKLSRLSFMPTAKGYYRDIVNEIEKWTGEYPQQISFYHLHPNDFLQIRSYRSGRS